MRRPRLLLLAGLLPLTACTSFADTAPAASSGSATSAATSTAPSSSAAPAGDLAVTDQTDLGTAADTVTAARVVVDDAGTPTTLVVGAEQATVRSDLTTTSVSGTQVTDLAATATGTVGVTLTADTVSPDPLLGLYLLNASTDANGDGLPGRPVPLSPEQAAPRSLPAYAAASPDGDVLYVLAESSDGVGAEVYAVDPTTGELQDSAEVDTGFSDVTALDLGGLAVTGDGDLVVGLTLDTSDPVAESGSAAALLRLDADLRPSGKPVNAQEGSDRTEVLAVTTDADGEPVALVSDATQGVRLITPDLDAGTSSSRQVTAAQEATRAGSLAAGPGRAVATLLDQTSPTVAVAPLDGSAASTLVLCPGSGDALAVAASGDGFLVVGTCDSGTVLWTLG